MNNTATIIPFTIDSALSEVSKFIQLIDGIREVSAKIDENPEQIERFLKMLKQQELNEMFLTLDQVAEALHCEKKSATKALRERNVEIITSSKPYVVYRDNFLNAFRNE